MGTQSDEAAKLYDATITQYVGLYNDANFDGIGGSLDKMLKADPNFSELVIVTPLNKSEKFEYLILQSLVRRSNTVWK